MPDLDLETRLRAAAFERVQSLCEVHDQPHAPGVKGRKAELLGVVAAARLQTTGPVEAWFYDPPWTPPFLRRNEVVAPIG